MSTRFSLRRPAPIRNSIPASYGFMPDDMDRQIYIDNVLGLETASLRQIIEILRKTYCGTVGYEFMHISSPEQKAWIQERIEGPDKEVEFTELGKKAILSKAHPD